MLNRLFHSVQLNGMESIESEWKLPEIKLVLRVAHHQIESTLTHTQIIFSIEKSGFFFGIETTGSHSNSTEKKGRTTTTTTLPPYV